MPSLNPHARPASTLTAASKIGRQLRRLTSNLDSLASWSFSEPTPPASPIQQPPSAPAQPDFMVRDQLFDAFETSFDPFRKEDVVLQAPSRSGTTPSPTHTIRASDFLNALPLSREPTPPPRARIGSDLFLSTPPLSPTRSSSLVSSFDLAPPTPTSKTVRFSEAEPTIRRSLSFSSFCPSESMQDFDEQAKAFPLPPSSSPRRLSRRTGLSLPALRPPPTIPLPPTPTDALGFSPPLVLIAGSSFANRDALALGRQPYMATPPADTLTPPSTPEKQLDSLPVDIANGACPTIVVSASPRSTISSPSSSPSSRHSHHASALRTLERRAPSYVSTSFNSRLSLSPHSADAPAPSSRVSAIDALESFLILQDLKSAPHARRRRSTAVGLESQWEADSAVRDWQLRLHKIDELARR